MENIINKNNAPAQKNPIEQRIEKEKAQAEKLVGLGFINQDYELYTDPNKFALESLDNMPTQLAGEISLLIMLVSGPRLRDGIEENKGDVINREERIKIKDILSSEYPQLNELYELNKFQSSNLEYMLSTVSHETKHFYHMNEGLKEEFENVRFEFNGTPNKGRCDNERYKYKLKTNLEREEVEKKITAFVENFLKTIFSHYNNK